MPNKPIDEWDEQYLHELIENGTQENKNLEYKQELKISREDDKKEFLADVSAFANTSGGYLVFGISEKRNENGEKTGIPEEIRGITHDGTPDTLIQRIDSLIRDGIEPRIFGSVTKPMTLQDERTVVVIWIPQSWNSPHMVTKGTSRFFARSSSGKYPLDVQQIRSAFLMSETLTEKMRGFRLERVAKIISTETPIQLFNCQKTVIHLLPFATYNTTNQVDVKRARVKDIKLDYDVYCGPVRQFNFDGVIFLGQETRNEHRGYLQLFRDGSIEYVIAEIFEKEDGKIASQCFDEDIIKAVKNCITLEKFLNIDSPYFLTISLVGYKNYEMAIPFRYSSQGKPIDRDNLLFPEILINDESTLVETILHPFFDQVWQAAGLNGSMFYGNDGKHLPYS
jgi:hypothetical protein